MHLGLNKNHHHNLCFRTKYRRIVIQALAVLHTASYTAARVWRESAIFMKHVPVSPYQQLLCTHTSPRGFCP